MEVPDLLRRVSDAPPPQVILVAVLLVGAILCKASSQLPSERRTAAGSTVDQTAVKEQAQLPARFQGNALRGGRDQ